MATAPAPAAPMVSVPAVTTHSQKTSVVTTPAPTTASLSFGSIGSSVKTLQNALIKDGYLQVGIFTPGTFDGPTLRAVETFQCVENIVCSGATYGIVDSKTKVALGL